MKVTGSDSVKVEVARSVEVLPDHVGEDMRNIFLEMGAKKQADSLDEDEVPLLWKLQKSQRGVGKISDQLLEMCQRRNYYRRLLRLI